MQTTLWLKWDYTDHAALKVKKHKQEKQQTDTNQQQ